MCMVPGTIGTVIKWAAVSCLQWRRDLDKEMGVDFFLIFFKSYNN